MGWFDESGPEPRGPCRRRCGNSGEPNIASLPLLCPERDTICCQLSSVLLSA